MFFCRKNEKTDGRDEDEAEAELQPFESAERGRRWEENGIA
jgi:hypothetical protein